MEEGDVTKEDEDDEDGILGFHQSCDQNKNRNHAMKKVKSLRYDR